MRKKSTLFEHLITSLLMPYLNSSFKKHNVIHVLCLNFYFFIYSLFTSLRATVKNSALETCMLMFGRSVELIPDQQHCQEVQSKWVETVKKKNSVCLSVYLSALSYFTRFSMNMSAGNNRNSKDADNWAQLLLSLVSFCPSNLGSRSGTCCFSSGKREGAEVPYRCLGTGETAECTCVWKARIPWGTRGKSKVIAVRQ